MNIAVVHWVVNDVGGINSWTENIVQGLRQLGHVVQLYYGSRQRKLGLHPTKKVPRSRRWHLLPAKLLSYHPADCTRSVGTLNKYDLVIFAHPSPHPTKDNVECEHARDWQRFYRDVTTPKIAVFHDRHWDRTNAWIEEVKTFIHYAHAAQHHFIPSLKKLCSKGIPYDWGYFPLNMSKQLNLKGKRREWTLATQWLALKNHRHLIPRLLELELPLTSYGSGQTYHKLLPIMREVYKEDYHQDEVAVYNEDSPHIHYGHTEYSILLKRMARTWFSLDLSTQGMTNMTHWEPLTLGTISVMSNDTANDQYCEIPEDCCMVFHKLETVVEAMNKIGRLPDRKLADVSTRAWQFVQRCRCDKVAEDLLQKWEANR